MKYKTKLALNVAISFLLFVILINLVGFESIINTVRSVKIELFLFALLCYAAVTFIMSYRIVIVLANIHQRLTLMQVVPSNLAGMLASDFTPARIGYFFTAFSLSSKFEIPLDKTIITIFGPQLFDFLIKTISASILFFFLVDKFGAGNLFTNLIVLFLIFVGVLVAGLFVFYPPFLNYFKIFEKLPFVSVLSSFLRRMHAHSDKVLAIKWPIIWITTISWVVKGLEWFAIAKALNISVFTEWWQDFLFMMVFQAAITILQFLPLPTIAGAGASEAGFAVILSVFGVPFETSVAFGFLTRLVMIIVDIFSLPVLLDYLHKHGLEKSLAGLSKLSH